MGPVWGGAKFLVRGSRPREALNKLLREPMAALRGAQILAYLNDMSRILRSVRLALDSLATLVQRIPKQKRVARYS